MNRPTSEMMLGIEKWLPLYMTGMIQSYYSEEMGGSLFNHILIKSDNEVFKRIRITACEGSHVVISRNAGRVLHFTIEHPILISSIKSLLDNMIEQRL